MPDNSEAIPPSIESAVTDVSASKGVGSGRIAPLAPLLIVILIGVVSIFSTSSSYSKVGVAAESNLTLT